MMPVLMFEMSKKSQGLPESHKWPQPQYTCEAADVRSLATLWIGTPEMYLRQAHRQLARGEGRRSQAPARDASCSRQRSACFSLFVMMYVWQHFSAIEYGYKIEQLSAKQATLIMESNRAASSLESVS